MSYSDEAHVEQLIKNKFWTFAPENIQRLFIVALTKPQAVVDLVCRLARYYFGTTDSRTQEFAAQLILAAHEDTEFIESVSRKMETYKLGRAKEKLEEVLENPGKGLSPSLRRKAIDNPEKTLPAFVRRRYGVVRFFAEEFNQLGLLEIRALQAAQKGRSDQVDQEVLAAIYASISRVTATEKKEEVCS